MSTNTLERVLWELSGSRESRSRFKDDPKKFLARFHLSDDERQMIEARDVHGLLKSGVNTMLTMGFWMELEGGSTLPEYLRRIRTVPQ
jgi:hypothetical protein